MKRQVDIMKRHVISIIYLFTALFVIGCSHTKEVTEIKPRVVYPEIIEDTLNAEFIDTLFTATEIIHNDTVKYIEFKPDPSLLSRIRELQKENKFLKSYGTFHIKIKPDSIVLWDTVKVFQTIEKKIETPLLSKMGLVFLGIVIAAAGYFMIRRRI